MTDLKKVLAKLTNLRNEEKYLIYKIKSFQDKLQRIGKAIQHQENLISKSGIGYKNGRNKSRSSK